MGLKAKFSVGDSVSVKGWRGVHIVHAITIVSIPTIIKGGFSLVETEMVKFFNGSKDSYFYAWAADLKIMHTKRRIK